MTNFEQYKDFFLKTLEEKGNTYIGLVNGKPIHCYDTTCNQCEFYVKFGMCSGKFANWLKEEYKEPEVEELKVDWTKVPVNTEILVKDVVDGVWNKRHFAKYDIETKKVFAWSDGRTSWTDNGITSWDYAKLAEENKE